MAAGRRREAWYHTALLVTMQAEMNRDQKQRSQPFTEADFHPDGPAAYGGATERRAPPLTAADDAMLSQLFPSKGR